LIKQLSQKITAIERRLPPPLVDLSKVPPRELESGEVLFALAIVMNVPDDIVWAGVRAQLPNVYAAYCASSSRTRSAGVAQRGYVQSGARHSGLRLAKEILCGFSPAELTQIIEELRRPSRLKRLPAACPWLSQIPLSRLPRKLRKADG
jgi:hypothetical protein